ncbi:MAG: replication/maintenance protein [Archaeoglobales archaeon]|nr:MAG: replication/maintenance protein [Archaeoglobales archaeon]
MEVLMRRRDTVKLLILTLILDGLNQREIAKRLRLTPQAISEYFKDLTSNGLVKDYNITEKGFRWLVERLFNLHVWTENILKDLYSRNIVAIAVGEVRRNDKVFYWFENGLIYCKVNENYNAIAITDGKDEEVLIKPLAFKPPRRGKVQIFVVPEVVDGGSKVVDVDNLRRIGEGKFVVSLGVEAFVACKKANLNSIFFGARCCCVEAVHHGCDVLVVCTRSLLNDLIQTLLDEGIEYEVV